MSLASMIYRTEPLVININQHPTETNISAAVPTSKKGTSSKSIFFWENFRNLSTSGNQHTSRKLRIILPMRRLLRHLIRGRLNLAIYVGHSRNNRMVPGSSIVP